MQVVSFTILNTIADTYYNTVGKPEDITASPHGVYLEFKERTINVLASRDATLVVYDWEVTLTLDVQLF